MGYEAAGGSASRRVVVVCLSLVVACAVALRVWNISVAPANFHTTRQYAGLALAKAWSGIAPDDAARRAAIDANGRSVPRLEPRILEAVTAGGYRIFGEITWLGGLISALLWCAGGVALFLLARRLASTLAAWVATAFYLFLPYSIEASRSFQPDPAMVAFLVAALLALVLYADEPTVRRQVVAGGLAGVAVLLKPVCLFVLAGGLIAVALSMRGPGAGRVRPRVVTYAALGLLPSATYYLYGMVAGGDLSSFASSGLLPGLWLDGAYWRGWLRQIEVTVTVAMLATAVAAVVLARLHVARRLMVGLLCGYVVMGLAFSYHIHSHDYYQLPLVPVVALGVGLTVDAVLARVDWRQWNVVMKVAGCVSLTVIASAVIAEDLRLARRGLSPIARRHLDDAVAIGDLIGHSVRTVVVAPAYGAALFYEGDFSGVPWPTRGDLRFLELQGKDRGSTEQRFVEVTRDADWFVITAFVEFAGQPELRPLLDRHATLVAQQPGYLVYDLRR